jgi:nucleoside-diphosphate-sugar epimerase
MAKYCIVGNGYIANALKKKIGEYSWYPTEKTKVIFYLTGPTHLDFEKSPFYFFNKEMDEIQFLTDQYGSRGVKIVYASTALVYETLTAFTGMKNRLEEQVLANKGIVARIFPVYGHEEKTFIGQTIKDMKNGIIPKIYGDGTQTRDFIFLDDVVNALIDLSKKESGIYDIGTGEMTAFNSIVHMVNKELGTEIVPEYIDVPKDYVIEGVRSKKPLLTYTPVEEAIKILCKN